MMRGGGGGGDDADVATYLDKMKSRAGTSAETHWRRRALSHNQGRNLVLRCW